MSYSLVIVDMQQYFTASLGQRISKACVREIKKAMRDKAPILFVEFVPATYGSSLPSLTNLVKNYGRAYHVTKSSNDGGKEVIEFLTKKHLPKLNLRVIGVNTDYCVAQTVNGIKHNCASCHIHVIADACDSIVNHMGGLKYMHGLDQVKILRHKGTL